MKLLLPAICFFCFYLLLPAIGLPHTLTPDIDRPPVIGDSIPAMRMDYKIITNSDHSYGYDIFINGKLCIHQPSIPGVMGMKGFTRKADARKVAGLAIKKIKAGLMPPTILVKELDSLRIKV